MAITYNGAGVGGAIQTGVDQWTVAKANLVRDDLLALDAAVTALDTDADSKLVGLGASVDKEIVLFDGTTGKAVERMTGTGYVKVTSGVAGTPAATIPLATDVSGNLPLANLPTNFAQIFRGTVTLTDAQIKALPTTPITIVAAPGAGFRHELLHATLYLNANAGAYTNIDSTSNPAADLEIMWGTAGGWASNPIFNDAPNSITALSDFLGSASTQLVRLLGSGYMESWNDTNGFLSYPSAIATFTNKALTIAASNAALGNFTGGNAANSMKVVVYYVTESEP